MKNTSQKKFIKRGRVRFKDKFPFINTDEMTTYRESATGVEQQKHASSSIEIA
jgi:hypothetical protein